MRHDLLRAGSDRRRDRIPNKRFLDLERERVEVRSHRYGLPVAIITIACRGPGAGVLRRFAQAAALSPRAAGVLARTGDAELQPIVTHRDTEGPSALVDRLHRLARAFTDQSLSIEVGWMLYGAPGVADV